MRRALSTVAVSMACMGSAFIAVAQEAPEPAEAQQPQDDEAKARQLFLEGDKSYAEGNYEAAAAAFEQAYRLSPQPALLFNLANAYDRLERPAEALRYLRIYVMSAPAGEREILEKRVEALEKRVAAEAGQNQPAQPEQPEPTPPVPSPAPEPSQPPVSTSPVPEPSAAPMPAAVPADSEGSGPSALGLSLLIGGGVGVVTGAVLAGVALSARSEAEASCPEAGDGRICLAQAQDAVERDQTMSIGADIAFVVGTAAAAAGAVILIIDSGHGADARIHLHPNGLGVRGVF